MHFGPSRVTVIRVLSPNFGTPFISLEVNKARKVKSDAQVSMNKNSDPCRIFFLTVAGETVPPTHIFSNFWNCH